MGSHTRRDVAQGEPRSTGAAPDPDAFVRQFLTLVEEGWEPNLGEFVGRVPEAHQEQVFEAIDSAMANRDPEPPPPHIVSTAESFARPSVEVAPMREELDPLGPDAGPVSEPEPELEPETEDLIEDLAPAIEEEPGLPDLPGYAVEQCLGRTLVAFEESGRRRVALRFMPVPPDALRERLDATASALGPLSPAVIVADSIVETGADSALVRAYVEGVQLDEACVALSVGETVQRMLAVAKILAAVHARGVVHGGLKPSNLLVTPAGAIRMLDPGLAPADEIHPFVAPEQLKHRPADAASDVFSFGAILYLLLTGKAAFGVAGARELAQRISAADFALPRDLDPALSPGLESICLACLSLNRRERPSAAQIAQALQRWCDGRETGLRPALYRHLLQRSIKPQLRAVRDWVRHSMATSRQADRIECSYRDLLEREESWIFDVQRIRRLQVLLYAGVALVGLGAILISFGAGRAAPIWSAYLPAGACVLLWGAGLHARLRREFPAAVAFLAAGTLTSVVAALSLLAAAGMLVPKASEVALPFQAHAFSDAQIVAAASLGLLSSLAGFALVPLPLFAWMGVVFFGGAYGAAWMAADLPARLQAAGLLPLAGLIAVGGVLESRRQGRWAKPCFAAGVGVVVVLPPIVALSGRIFDPARIETRLGAFDLGYVGLAGLALLLMLTSVLLARSRSLGLRQTASFFGLSAPAYLIAALYMNAIATRSPWALAALCAGAVGMLAGCVGRRGNRSMLLAGLAALALGAHLAVLLRLVPTLPFAVGLAGLGAIASLWVYARQCGS